MTTRVPEKQTILLAEDTDEIRHMLADALGKNGYRVLEAGDGAEALNISDSYAGSIDILITDVRMPRLSGPDLIRDLKSRRPRTRIGDLRLDGRSCGPRHTFSAKAIYHSDSP